jgi:hypothetical protein
MQAVGSALDDADFVVQAFDKAQGDLVLGFAVGGNAVPVPLDPERVNDFGTTGFMSLESNRW